MRTFTPSAPTLGPSWARAVTKHEVSTKTIAARLAGLIVPRFVLRAPESCTLIIRSGARVG